MPLANDPVVSRRLIWSFNNLEHQNMSLISDSRGRARMVQREEKWDWKNIVVLDVAIRIVVISHMVSAVCGSLHLYGHLVSYISKVLLVIIL